MIPIKLNEMGFRSTDACFLRFQAILEIMKLELRGSRLHFYGEIIELIADGKTPETEVFQELALWTDSGLLLNDAHLSSSSALVVNNMVNEMVDNESGERATEPQSQSRTF